MAGIGGRLVAVSAACRVSQRAAQTQDRNTPCGFVASPRAAARILLERRATTVRLSTPPGFLRGRCVARSSLEIGECAL